MKLDTIQHILACPMCMSGAEGKTVLAANSAIALMLLVLSGILMSLLGFIVYLAKRARRFEGETSGTTDS